MDNNIEVGLNVKASLDSEQFIASVAQIMKVLQDEGKMDKHVQAEGLLKTMRALTGEGKSFVKSLGRGEVFDVITQLAEKSKALVGEATNKQVLSAQGLKNKYAEIQETIGKINHEVVQQDVIVKNLRAEVKGTYSLYAQQQSKVKSIGSQLIVNVDELKKEERELQNIKEKLMAISAEHHAQNKILTERRKIMKTTVPQLAEEGAKISGKIPMAEKLMAVSRVGGPVLMGLAGALTTVTAAAAKGVEEAEKYQNQLENVQLMTGFTEKQTQDLANAFRTQGKDIGQITPAFRTFSNAVSQAGTGAGKQAAAFKKLGVEVKDANGHIKSSYAVFTEAREALSKMEPGLERTRLLTQLFGRSGVTLGKVLTMNKNAWDSATASAERFGLQLTKGQLEAIEQHNILMSNLQQRMQGFSTQIGATVIPVLDELMKTFMGNGEGIKEWGQTVGKVVNYVIITIGAWGIRIKNTLNLLKAMFSEATAGITFMGTRIGDVLDVISGKKSMIDIKMKWDKGEDLAKFEEAQKKAGNVMADFLGTEGEIADFKTRTKLASLKALKNKQTGGGAETPDTANAKAAKHAQQLAKLKENYLTSLEKELMKLKEKNDLLGIEEKYQKEIVSLGNERADKLNKMTEMVAKGQMNTAEATKAMDLIDAEYELKKKMIDDKYTSVDDKLLQLSKDKLAGLEKEDAITTVMRKIDKDYMADIIKAGDIVNEQKRNEAIENAKILRDKQQQLLLDKESFATTEARLALEEKVAMAGMTQTDMMIRQKEASKWGFIGQRVQEGMTMEEAEKAWNDIAQNKMSATVTEGIQKGMIDSLRGGQFFKSFGDSLRAITSQSFSEGMAKSSNDVAKMIKGLGDNTLGGIGDAIFGKDFNLSKTLGISQDTLNFIGSGLANAILSPATGQQTGFANVPSAITSTQQVRGIVAGDIQVPIAQIGASLKDALHETNSILREIRENTSRLSYDIKAYGNR